MKYEMPWKIQSEIIFTVENQFVYFFKQWNTVFRESYNQIKSFETLIFFNPAL